MTSDYNEDFPLQLWLANPLVWFWDPILHEYLREIRRYFVEISTEMKTSSASVPAKLINIQNSEIQCRFSVQKCWCGTCTFRKKITRTLRNEYCSSMKAWQLLLLRHALWAYFGNRNTRSSSKQMCPVSLSRRNKIWHLCLRLHIISIWNSGIFQCSSLQLLVKSWWNFLSPLILDAHFFL